MRSSSENFNDTQARSYKNFDHEKFTRDLSEAPWHVGEVFDDLEDQVYYWNALMANIIDENLPLKIKEDEGKSKRCAIYDNQLEERYQS